MQLRLLAAMLMVVLTTCRAEAGICTLTLTKAGTLALSSDGYRLGSEEGATGSAATLTVLSIGSSTLTVSPPVVTQSPSAYNASGSSVQVAYSAPLSGASQAYTAAQTSFTVPNLINAVVMVVNNRITTTQGFAPGAYATRTVVTCS